MAEFLTTKGTSHHLEDIIINAKSDLFLISPFLQISKTLLERLRDADRQKVKIILIYGKDEMNAEEKKKLQDLKNLSLYFFKDLHAKCFFNEESMVITSMNMYEFSENNNREMGVLIHAKDDAKIYREAVKEAKSILNLAEKDSPMGSASSEVIKKAKSKPYSAIEDDSKARSRTSRTKTGYCIRCGTSKAYDLDAPYCRDCYKVWSEWQNPDYEEEFCHTCRKRASTSMAKPECNSCYRPGR